MSYHAVEKTDYPNSLTGESVKTRSRTCGCKCRTIAIILILAPIVLFSLAVGILVTVKYVASSSDAEKWIKIGNENAHKELEQFDSIAFNLSSAPTPDFTQLENNILFFQEQIKEAAENIRNLIPGLVGVIEKMNEFLASDDPSVFSKIGLRLTIWFIDGIRDNKSYYILDGAQLWCELRIKILQKYQSRTTDQLIVEFKSIQNKTIGVRDELDGMAQIFVKGIKDMHTMTSDIAGNLSELKKIAKELLVVSEQKEEFLKNTKDLELGVEDLVKKYSVHLQNLI